MLLQEDFKRGCLDGLGNIDDLLQTRNTERDIHRSNTCTMESIERHLRCGLSHGLSSNATHHFTGMYYCTLENFLNRASQLVEASFIKSFITDNFLCTKVAPQEDLEKHQRVTMGFHDNTVFA